MAGLYLPLPPDDDRVVGHARPPPTDPTGLKGLAKGVSRPIQVGLARGAFGASHCRIAGCRRGGRHGETTGVGDLRMHVANHLVLLASHGAAETFIADAIRPAPLLPQYQWWSFPLNSQEMGNASNTYNFDDSVVLDLPTWRP